MAGTEPVVVRRGSATRYSVLSPTGTGSGSVCDPRWLAARKPSLTVVSSPSAIDVEELDVEVRLGRVERGPEGEARMTEQHLVGGERRGGERHRVTGSSGAPGWWMRHGPARVGADRERAVAAEPELDSGAPVGSQRSSSRQPAPTPTGPSNDVNVGSRRDRDVGQPGDPVVEPRQQHAGRQLRGLGQRLRPLVVRRSVDHAGSSTSATGKKCCPRSVHRPGALGERLDVREGAGPEVVVVPAADREDRDRDRVEAVDERPVAPEPSKVGCARFAANSASASTTPPVVRFAMSGQLSISPRSVDLIPPGNTTSWYSDDGDCIGAIATRCSGRSTAAL